ncbi:MAG TPA: radical SAM protein, partial [Spirochaetales bacterium]|nr:radical SAM protein [Spirochaetales bacterium]
MSAGTIGFGLQKSSLIDYPGRVAAVAFLPGCPFACPYCHNPELVSGVDDDSLYSWAQVRTHLQARFGLLSGLVFSGGEPSMHDELGDYIEDARALGYAIKVDT